MPIYEYYCRACGSGFEKLVKVTDADAGVVCPACGSSEVERKLSAFATPAASQSCAPGGG